VNTTLDELVDRKVERQRAHTSPRHVDGCGRSTTITRERGLEQLDEVEPHTLQTTDNGDGASDHHSTARQDRLSTLC
jgi:hypothetical protein